MEERGNSNKFAYDDERPSLETGEQLKISMMKYIMSVIFCVFVTIVQAQNQDTLRLFLIGNSFSQNATTFLPQLAKSGGKVLVIGRAELPACSLKKHWAYAARAESDAKDPKGSPYGGKSLKQLLEEQPWDIVSLQQSSFLSSDSTTYEPYLSNLASLIKSVLPNTKIVLHETWAYRADDTTFSQLSNGQKAFSADAMFASVKASYRKAAVKLNTVLVPTGEAFEMVRRSNKWGFVPNVTVDRTSFKYPSLPAQRFSLHVGYFWKNKNLKYDSHHASKAGCYLGSLVWYNFLFGKFPIDRVPYVPKAVDRSFAAFLQQTADSVVAGNGQKEGL